MLGYYLQAYIIWQTDCKASSTVCSLLISAAQSTWHLRGSVKNPSSLHTLGMTIASSHTSSFMADDLSLDFPSSVSSGHVQLRQAVNENWMKRAKNILQFSYFVALHFRWSRRLWKTWFERRFKHFATAQPAQASQWRSRDWSIGRTAGQQWEERTVAAVAAATISSLITWSVFLFVAGELKPALPIKFTAIRRMLTHGGGGFSDCDIVQQAIDLKPIAKLAEGCCSARSLIARSLRTWTWWIDAFWGSLKGKAMRAI